MERTPASSAETQELVDIALEKTEQAALKNAADTKAKVADVKDLQRMEFLKLMNVKGSDGSAAGGEDMCIPVDLKAQVDKGIEEQHAERMKNIAAAKDAYVLPDEGTVVGLQHDGTREIGIAGRGLKDDRVAKHEAKHREQEAGDESVDMPLTDDPEIAEIRQLSRRALRENGAVKAEGGLKDHTPEYHEYVNSSNRIAKYLKAQGMDGGALVEEAGDTNAGFDKLHQSIVLASVKQRIEKMSEADQVLTA
ncbi:MAG: hypothetical protein KBA40_02460 [Candidatus Peribacteraceae bacterium]|nr:hypothetical protein [Candidatus Peribacteraceae bacterium]MBP9850673.1 hypothetical protein [Candidatus Peribacteraceae bacterium]